MAEWLRTPIILAENQVSVPRAHIKQLKLPVTPVPEDTTPSLASMLAEARM